MFAWSPSCLAALFLFVALAWADKALQAWIGNGENAAKIRPVAGNYSKTENTLSIVDMLNVSEAFVHHLSTFHARVGKPECDSGEGCKY